MCMYVQGKSSEAADAIAAAVVKYNADPSVITQALARTVSSCYICFVYVPVPLLVQCHSTVASGEFCDLQCACWALPYMQYNLLA